MTDCLTDVLIVDDEPDVCTEVSSFLRRRGYRTAAAGNAQEALAFLERHEAKVVFTDIDMPGRTNGIDLARWLERHRPGIATIMTSGAFPWLPAGSPIAHLPFLPKPADLSTLDRLIRRRLLEEERDLREGHEDHQHPEHDQREGLRAREDVP